MYASDCVRGSVRREPGPDGTLEGRDDVVGSPQEEELGMRNRLRLPALAITVIWLLAACSGGTASSPSAGESAAPAESAAESAAASEAASEAPPAEVASGAPAAVCASSD